MRTLILIALLLTTPVAFAADPDVGHIVVEQGDTLKKIPAQAFDAMEARNLAEVVPDNDARIEALQKEITLLKTGLYYALLELQRLKTGATSDVTAFGPGQTEPINPADYFDDKTSNTEKDYFLMVAKQRTGQ